MEAGSIKVRRATTIAGLPGYRRLESVSGMAFLTFATIRATVTRPYSWLGDFSAQYSLGLRRTIVPVLFAFTFFSIGTLMSNIGGITESLGISDRTVGASITGEVRETSFWLAAMIFVGILGSANCADLGARRVREELDAIRVLGIDPTRSLVAPRVWAMTLIAPVLGMLACAMQVIVGALAAPVVVPNYYSALSLDGIHAQIFALDIVSLILKMAVLGFLTGIITSYKGMTCGGGAEGVGRAVNQAVLILFIALWVLNSVWNLVVISNLEDLRGFRG